MLKLLRTLFVVSVLVVATILFSPKMVEAVTLSRLALLDVNRDGKVSSKDMNLVRRNLGIISPLGVKALTDVNQDGVINVLDVRLFNRNIGRIVTTCEMADVDNSGTVNSLDLDIMGQYYYQEVNSGNMMADLTGDGTINILDMAKAGGVYGCSW